MVFAHLQSQIQPTRDRVAEFASGTSNIEGLVVVKRTSIKTTYLEIKPDPWINNVTAKMVSFLGQAGIQVGVNDFDVKGISAKYTQEQLNGIGISYIVGADMSTGIPVGGILCQEVMGTLNNTRSGISWDIVLTRKQGR